MDRRIPAWTFMLMGIALFICGLYAAQKNSSALLNKIIGPQANYAKWYLIGGIFSVVLGLIIRFRKHKRQR